MTREEIALLEQLQRNARQRYTDALAKAWPVKRRVEFNLQHGQKNPSVGDVIAHSDGCVVIRLDPRPMSYGMGMRDGAVKRVHHTNMITEPR